MCGLRVSEACSLTVDNIDWSTDSPSLRFTDKRGKERVVPMNPEVQDVLREVAGVPSVFGFRVRLLQSPQRTSTQPQDCVGSPEDLRPARGDPPRPSAHAQAYLRHGLGRSGCAGRADQRPDGACVHRDVVHLHLCECRSKATFC